MRTLSCVDPGYPSRLREMEVPPLLYTSGDLSIGKEPCVLFTGSRHADHFACKEAFRWAVLFSRQGWNVVTSDEGGSDMAVRQALLRERKKPIVMLSEGLPIGGNPRYLLVTPFPKGTRKSRENRYGMEEVASRMCHAAVIAQAYCPSSSLWAAKNALDGGGEVLLLPSALGGERRHKGGNLLYGEGAPVLRRCLSRYLFLVRSNHDVD